MAFDQLDSAEDKRIQHEAQAWAELAEERDNHMYSYAPTQREKEAAAALQEAEAATSVTADKLRAALPPGSRSLFMAYSDARTDEEHAARQCVRARLLRLAPHLADVWTPALAGIDDCLWNMNDWEEPEAPTVATYYRRSTFTNMKRALGKFQEALGIWGEILTGLEVETSREAKPDKAKP